MIAHPSVKSLSSVFVDNFDQDIKFLENFIDGVGDTNLYDVLLELRQVKVSYIAFWLIHDCRPHQMITLLKATNMEEFSDNSIRNKKYSRLNSTFTSKVLLK
jgi:hypothetical protein